MTQIGLHNFEESYVIEIVIDSCYFSVIFISAILCFYFSDMFK